MSSSVPPSRGPSRGLASTLRDRFRAGLNSSRDRSGNARFRREGEPPVIDGTAAPARRPEAAAAVPAAPAAPAASAATAPADATAPTAATAATAATAVAAPAAVTAVTAAPAAAQRPRRRTRGIAAAKGSRSLGGAAAGRRGAWLLPLLLMVGLAALLALAIATFLGSTDDDGGNAARDTAAQQRDANGTGGAAAPSEAAIRPGALGITGRSVATGSTLTPYVGQQVEARGMEVVQVDEGGFFVGGGKGERTFVEWGDRAGGDEATRMPSVGDRVNLSGPVAEPPRQPGRTLGVPVASERVILKQGGYVNADEVTPAG